MTALPSSKMNLVAQPTAADTTASTSSLSDSKQGQRGPRPPIPSVCLDHLKGKCDTRRLQCRYLHPDLTDFHRLCGELPEGVRLCEVFVLTGDCKFGPKCNKFHPALPEMEPMLGTANASHSSSSSVFSGSSRAPAKRGPTQTMRPMVLAPTPTELLASAAMWPSPLPNTALASLSQSMASLSLAAANPTTAPLFPYFPTLSQFQTGPMLMPNVGLSTLPYPPMGPMPSATYLGLGLPEPLGSGEYGQADEAYPHQWNMGL